MLRKSRRPDLGTREADLIKSPDQNPIFRFQEIIYPMRMVKKPEQPAEGY